jgi:uncharacterized membrane protein YbhN (UPF0104 family)
MSRTLADDASASSFSKMLKIFFAVAGTLGILLLAWRYLSADVLMNSLNTLHPLPLVASLAIYILINVLRGYRFILLGADLSWMDSFSMASVYTALLRVMPFRSGELSLGLMLKRTGKGGFGQGVIAVLMLRVIDVVLVMILSAVSLSTYLKLKQSVRIAVIAVLTSLLIGFLFFVSTPVARAANRFVSTRNAKALWIRAIKAGIAMLELSLRSRILLLASSSLIWGLIVVWFYLLMIGTGIGINTADGFTVSMLGIVGSMLPLTLIGSFGPMEGGFALGLAAVGFTPEVAASLSVIISTFTFAQNWIVAIPAWLWVLTFASKKRD